MPKVDEELKTNIVTDSLEAIQYVRSETDAVILPYSTGKDSLATWLRLLEVSDFTIIPVYYYQVPDLDFVNRYLDDAEDFFETRILRVPHPRLTWWLQYGTHMPPVMARQMIEFDYPYISYEDMTDFLIEEYGLPEKTWEAVGTTQNDSAQRRLTFRKYGLLRKFSFKFYPIGDFTKTQVMELIQRNKFELPVDYRIWGRSFDGVDIFYLDGVKEHFPKDYQKILDWIPLIRLEHNRYEIWKRRTEEAPNN